MQAPYKFLLRNQTLWLSGEKCMYWEEAQSLVLSDLHLGKTGHFRKQGIGVPQQLFREDMQRLTALVQFFKPRQLLVTGDFFHSHANRENDYFEKWRSDFSSLDILLVMGNHDVLEADFYSRNHIRIAGSTFRCGDFVFTHDAADSSIAADGYLFSGHIHPGILLSGAGRQSARLPCFYFGRSAAILPAFGRFTGTHLVEPVKGDAVFAIAAGRVLPLPQR